MKVIFMGSLLRALLSVFGYFWGETIPFPQLINSFDYIYCTIFCILINHQLLPDLDHFPNRLFRHHTKNYIHLWFYLNRWIDFLYK